MNTNHSFWHVWSNCRDAWLATKSHHSRRAYLRDWEGFFAFCNVSPWEVTAHHAQAWLKHLQRKYNPTTVNRKISALTSFYSFAAHYDTEVN